ncbi:helix-turn-helix domain-containing protein [Geoalkalibacter subterraneus]|uniref:Uncharacterized protein n=1 Tax=Geoalkalibacter subterraneus TaxID=483547 RepID=A0A0B5FN89_9BACT|nr:helix-turn-helix domain-containing protein [Geoalkalibacter subterraneus]AJF06039.1 hypothetical protein GSUB_04945 [Geoalkalibacter subterraneus]
MSTSLREFKQIVLEKLLDFLWRQWTAIGVSGYGSSEETKVVDPEALLLLTLTVARYDPRLFDQVMDWLELNGDFLNIQRLQNITQKFEFQCGPALSSVAEILGQKTAVALKWKKLATKYVCEEEEPLFFQQNGNPLPAPKECDEIFRRHGLLRPPYQRRKLSRPFPRNGMPPLLLRLRALFGVSHRCEILSVLGSTDEMHPSQIAKVTGFGPRSTQNILAEMVHSGAIQVRSDAREKFYALTPGILDQLLRPQGPTPWVKSIALFRALEILWIEISNPGLINQEPLVLASQWRVTAKKIKPLLGDAGFGQPLREGAYTGEKYHQIFADDIVQVIKKL